MNKVPDTSLLPSDFVAFATKLGRKTASPDCSSYVWTGYDAIAIGKASYA